MTEPHPTLTTDSPSSKVGRLLSSYNLTDFGDELERRWTGHNSKRDSLRTLADPFNQQVLTSMLEKAEHDPLDGEVENLYGLLTSDDVTSGTRTETEARLRQQGIDVDQLHRDFVTHQAIRTYLKDVRGASYSSNITDRITATQSSFDSLIGRTTAVVEQTLRTLRSSGQLTLDSFHVRRTVSVYCEACETQYDVTTLLSRGG